MEGALRCLIISDFTVDNLAAILNNDQSAPLLTAGVAPFNQVISTLNDGNLPCWRERPDFAVVWTRPESAIGSFSRAMEFAPVAIGDILDEVDAFAASLSRMSARVKFALVPTWTLPASNRGMGLLDMRGGLGLSNILMRMNLRLAEALEKSGNIFLLDAQRWMCACGSHSYSPKLWYMAKVPFDPALFMEAASDIKAAAGGMTGRGRKLIILDLDDTLWGGIVGDVGWENLNIGGHDHLAEAYADFQRALKALTRRGILLGIVSKNDETIAREAITKHPEMILRLDDFAGMRINWNDKARNIVELVAELNLGLQSAVFIDDSPFERARVREALPEVFVPEWPDDKMLYRSALTALRCFDTPAITAEDRQRTGLYASERKREETKKEFASLDTYLESLDMTVTVEPLRKSNLKRAAQLLNKTNQMNLSTRRMTEDEFMGWAGRDGRAVWTYRASDKFGDLGLVGIASVEIVPPEARIVDFVLSCRVVGRRMEETMLFTIVEHARARGVSAIRAEYLPTPKNAPCLEFWTRSLFERQAGTNVFVWPAGRPYALPKCIRLITGEPKG